MTNIFKTMYALLIVLGLCAGFSSLFVPAARAGGPATYCDSRGYIQPGGTDTCVAHGLVCRNGICQGTSCTLGSCPDGFACEGGSVCVAGTLGDGGGGVIDLGGLSAYKSAIIGVINEILVPVLTAIAFLVFLWGIFKYFIYGAEDEGDRAKGRQLVLWGLIGFAVIFSMWGLVNLAIGTLGLGTDGTRPDYPLL